jgi:type IV pilus assembly protein PilB
VEQLNEEVPQYYRGLGCKKCRNTGHSGRIGIHELFVLDEEIAEMINMRSSFRKLRNKAIEKGMVPLQIDGLEKVKAGIVCIEEVLRIINKLI